MSVFVGAYVRVRMRVCVCLRMAYVWCVYNCVLVGTYACICTHANAGERHWVPYHSLTSSFKIGPFDEPGAGLVNVTEIRPPFTPHRLGVQAM